ncbi:MAG: metallophosphoesterase, partial [Bacteroidota bacterium]
MTIQYCSDLHLEFPENHKYVTNNPIEPIGDILVLAGDIVSFAAMSKRQNFFDYIADNFETTYWIPGNHEYYDSDISERSGTFEEKIRDNIFLVNNHSFVHGKTRLVFSTMWSAISEMNKWKVENYISDFRAIRFHDKNLTTENFNELHKASLRYITAELEKDWNATTVVVTHHVPTFMNYPKKYKGDSLNEVFAVELSDVIERTHPDYWIYGHHHSNTSPFSIGSTKLITNQLGYVHHHEHGSFDNTKHITL